jgi:hypothetical protein
MFGYRVLGFGDRRVVAAPLPPGPPIVGYQVEYTTPGTFAFVPPAGVTSVCVVCIGGGGGGMYYSNSSSSFSYAMQGGGGGGLGYKNNITVVPGTEYAITVGAGGSQGSYSAGSEVGGTSYTSMVADTVLKGSGGNPGRYYTTIYGGGWSGDGGGSGGRSYRYTSSGNGPSGGGGAGGYSGLGGGGGTQTTGQFPTSITGGGGAGGGTVTFPNRSAGGGGTGLLGAGTSGTVNTTGGGGGGSGGTAGATATSAMVGGLYGGGGGGSSSLYQGTGGDGGKGAVRILWGAGRAYPSTNTADEFPTTGYRGVTNPTLQYIMSAQAGTSLSANTPIDLSNGNTTAYTGNWTAFSASTATAYINNASVTRYYYPLTTGATLKTVTATSGNTAIIANNGFTFWITMIPYNSSTNWSRPWGYFQLASGTTGSGVSASQQYHGPLIFYNRNSSYMQVRRPSPSSSSGDYAYTAQFSSGTTSTVTLVVSQNNTGVAKYWMKRDGTTIAAGTTFSFSGSAGYGIRTTENSATPAFADSSYWSQVAFNGIMESGFANRPYTDAECLTLATALDDDFRR